MGPKRNIPAGWNLTEKGLCLGCVLTPGTHEETKEHPSWRPRHKALSSNAIRAVGGYDSYSSR